MKIMFNTHEDTEEDVRKIVDFWYGRNHEQGQQKLVPDESKEELEEKQERKYYCNNKKCKKEITKANVAYCLNNKDLFGGKVFCEDCQANLKEKEGK